MFIRRDVLAMPLSFVTNADQPFVVRLKDPESNSLRPDTAVVFQNFASLTTWEEIVIESRLCHPLAIMSLFHAQWDKFKDHFAQTLLLELDDAKVQSVEHFLKNETPYNADDGKRVTHPIPFMLSEPVLKNNQLSFYIHFLSGPDTHSKKNYAFSVEEITKSFIESQHWIFANLQLEFSTYSAPPQVTFSEPLTQLKNSMDSDFDNISIKQIWSGGPIPEFYQLLWKAINNDFTIPGILRYKLLVDFYERILKGYLDNSGYEEANKILITPEWNEVVKQYFHLHTFTPNDLAKMIAKKSEPEHYASHMAGNMSGSISSTLTSAVSLVRNDNLVSKKLLPEFYEKMIKDELSAIKIYFLQQCLYRAIVASPHEAGFEHTYLLKYAEQLRAVLTDIEYLIGNQYTRLWTVNTLGASNRMLDKTADEDIQRLKQSPFAWQELLEQFQIDVALQNAALGYRVQTEKRFKVQNITKSAQEPYEFEVKYTYGDLKSSFKIRNSIPIEKYLRGKTQETFFSLPLVERVNKLYENLENAQKQESDNKQARLRELLSDNQMEFWSSHPRIAYLRLNLIKCLVPKSPPLTGQEKTNLVVYALIAAAMEDEDLIESVSKLFEVMVTTPTQSGLFTSHEIMAMIAGFARNEWPAIDRVVKKTHLLLKLVEKGVIRIPINLGELHPVLESVSTLQTYVKQADLKDNQLEDGLQKHERERAKFIKKNFSRELENYAKADPQVILRLYVYLNEVDEGQNSTLNLLDEIANLLFNAINQGAILSLIKELPYQVKTDLWLAGVLFRSLAQAKIYDMSKKFEDQDYERLILLSFADVLLDEIADIVKNHIDKGKVYDGKLLDSKRQAVKAELDVLESKSLQKDIIPWYHTHFDAPLPDLLKITPGEVIVTKKKIKKRKITLPDPVPTDSSGSENSLQDSQSSHSSSSMFTAAAAVVSTLKTAVQDQVTQITQFVTTEVPMKKRVVTFENISDDEPQLSTQTQQRQPQKVPQKVLDYTEANRKLFKDAINNMVARFRPAANVRATLYYDPAAYIQGWLQGKPNLTKEDYPELDVNQGKELGPEKLIENYQTLKNEIIAWLKQEQIPVGKNYFAELDAKVLQIREQNTSQDNALSVELTKLYGLFIDSANNKHASELVLPEMSDIVGTIQTAPLKLSLQILDAQTKRLRANFEKQKQNLLDARETYASSLANAKSSLAKKLSGDSSLILDALQYFEHDIKARAQIENKPNFFAKILADGQYDNAQALSGNPKKIADLLHAATVLRYRLLTLSKTSMIIEDFDKQYENVISAGIQQSHIRKRLSLLKPWQWIKIYKLNQKCKTIEKEMGYFNEATNRSKEVLSINDLKEQMSQLLQENHNKASLKTKEQLFWTANKLLDNHGITEYKRLKDKLPEQKIQACEEALSEFKKCLDINFPSSQKPPMAKNLFEFLRDCKHLSTPLDPLPAAKELCLAQMFNVGVTGNSVSTIHHVGFDHKPGKDNDDPNLSSTSNAVFKQQTT